MSNEINDIKRSGLELRAEVRVMADEWEQLRRELEEKVDITKTQRFIVTDANGNTAEYVRRDFCPCDPIKNKYCRKTGCYMYGGPCKMTSNVAHRRDGR